MGLGGGASGEVVLPEYLIYQQAAWLNGVEPKTTGTYASSWSDYSGQSLNVMDEMVTASVLNPFTALSAYDPEPVLSDIEDMLGSLNDIVDDIDPEQSLSDAILAGLEQADTVFSESYISTAVSTFETSTNGRFLRRIGRSMGSVQGARAVMTTQYGQFVGEHEFEREYEVADYEARLRLGFHQQRAQLAQTFAAQYVDLIRLNVESLRVSTQVTAEIGKLRIAAKQDQINIDSAYDQNEARWKLDLFDYGKGMISAYSGGGAVPRPATTGERIMQNVLTAASTGIAVGTAVGNPGIGLLAAGGTLLAGALTGNLK